MTSSPKLLLIHHIGSCGLKGNVTTTIGPLELSYDKGLGTRVQGSAPFTSIRKSLMFMSQEDRQGMALLPTPICGINSKLSWKHLSPQSERKCFPDLACSQILQKKKKKIKFTFKLPNAPCRSVIDHESVGKIWSILYKSGNLKQAL